jgi:hypothetical protein
MQSKYVRIAAVGATLALGLGVGGWWEDKRGGGGVS